MDKEPVPPPPPPLPPGVMAPETYGRTLLGRLAPPEAPAPEPASPDQPPAQER